MTKDRNIADAMRRAALAVSGAEGERIYEQLLTALVGILGVEFGLVAVYPEPSRTRLQTLATFFDGRIAGNIVYDIAGTPCASAIGRAFRYLPDGVAAQFPEDGILVEHRIEGYAAATLNDAYGRAIGVLAVMSRRPLDDKDLFEAMLKIFAARAGAEIERRRSEASYRTIFEAAETAILVLDFETGAIVDANPKACATFGIGVDELRRLSLDAFGSGEPPYTGAEARRLIDRARQGELVRSEWHRRNRGGSLHWDEITLKKVEIAGTPHIFVATREITERKAAEERLRTSEEQYRSIFDATTDSLVLRDAGFRIVDVNPAYERLGGHRREDVVGSTELTLQVPELNEDRRRLHTRAIAGEAFHVESEARRKDGSRFLLEVYGVPMVYRGQPHVLYVGRDITDRRAAEDRLRASEEQYRAIFNASADSLVLRDAGFRIVDVNAAYEAMSGRTRAEAVGRMDLTMSNPALTARIRAMHGRALAGETVTWEADAKRKDGGTFQIEVRGVPIRHRDQPHVLYIGRDISPRRRAEAEREQLEAQLRQAQKMEAIGQLTGGIAHDFNNILQGILGNLVLAAERQAELGDARLGKYLERAQHSSKRARELIAQMLTFSRGQRGARRAVRLAELVQDACKLLRSTLPATIDLRLSLDEEVPPLSLDPVQMEQVVLNLCINARDAMGGSGAIRLGLLAPRRLSGVCTSCRQKVDGHYAELYVRDTGPGIAPSVMERMFEPFYSTKAVGRGSGMGLSLAHGIVHEHGGHILVDSIQNERTKFRVLLPAASSGAGEPPAEESNGRLSARSRPQLRGRVMVVDDEEVIREFMQDLLSGWGLEVDTAADGTAARDALAAQPQRYDLVITDQTMPGLTGLALAREIARLRPGLPVILYTGFASDLSQRELDAACVAALVRKPIEPAQLLPLLRERLSSR